MNKTNIYVSVRTPEECKRAYEILSRAGEEIHISTLKDLKEGIVDKYYEYLFFDGKDWTQTHNYEIHGLSEITLDHLESMLCGKGEEANLSPEDMIKKEFGSEPCFSVNTRSGESVNLNRIIDIIKKHADQQTSSLRKDLEGKTEAQQRLRECSFELLENITQSTEELNWIKLKDSLENYKTKLKAIFK